MGYIVFFVFCALFFLSVCFRQMVTHFPQTVYYLFRDLYRYVRYAQWRNLKTGQLIAYVGLFGKGKTLSAVHYIVGKYKKYNGRKVYDSSRKKWVVQRVYILSNVDLSIPYEKFTGLKQIVDLTKTMRMYDDKNGTLTCVLVLGDEFSVQLNSRSFKSNIDPLFLNTLLTCRHHHITLVYTSQRFNHVDALLRQVTSYVVSCNKCWRFMVHAQFDAFALENATDPTLVRPMHRFGWFIHNKDYNAYDTLACVGNLSKSCQDGDMMSETEILSLISDNGVQMEAVSKPSRTYQRNQKKINK